MSDFDNEVRKIHNKEFGKFITLTLFKVAFFLFCVEVFGGLFK